MKLFFPATLFIMLSSTIFYGSDFQLPKIFGANMVLQRDMLIPVWGRGEAGAKVDIEFAGTSTSAIVKTNGEWKTYLPEFPAGGPYEMRLGSTDTTVVFTNILIGDVWLASGQSNMQWSVENSNDAEKERVIKRDIQFQSGMEMSNYWGCLEAMMEEK